MEYTSREVYEYVSKKSNDPIVEWKKCRLSGQEFPIYKSDLEFYDKVSPTFEVSEEYVNEFFEKNHDVKDNFEYKDGKLKAKLPTPTLCPEERERQRFAFRNESNLYIGINSIIGKNIITTISPDKKYLVYSYDQWRSDLLNPMIYGNGIGKLSVFDMLNDLLCKVPTYDRYVKNNENADYTNIVANSKNSYLCFASECIQECLYSWYTTYSNSCVDCLICDYSQMCFDCVNIHNCMFVCYSDNCNDCSYSSYLYNCTGCHDCFNCSNLINKSYCIDNKQYSKSDYQKQISQDNHSNLKKLVSGCFQVSSNNSFGNNLLNCNNCYFIGSGIGCSGIKYTSLDCSIDSQYKSEDCYDTYFCDSILCISMISCRFSHYSGFIYFGNNLKNCWYSANCFDCSNCFGCVGLKNKEYCIFNKQYTKEEYNKLVPEIIAQMIRDKEWGEFFDPQLSYYGYNETMANDYYPLTKEEAIKMGYKRSDYESPMPHVEKTVEGKKLPHQGCKIIQEKKPDILEKIVNYAVICEVSGKPFRITRQEIDFYIKHNLPLPTKHPNVRHQERLARKDPTTMKLIHCDECGEEMLSVHTPGEGKRILCEKCYYKEV